MRDELLDIIPMSEIKRVFDSEYCELDVTFMGFTDTYKALASIISKGHTIIDFGCYAAAQCYYFKDFKRYIGVDNLPMEEVPKPGLWCERFKCENTEHYVSSIQNFIENIFPELDIPNECCFAICNYVPDFKAQELVRKTFMNVFNFYPTGLVKWEK